MAGTLAGWAAARLAGADRLRFAEAWAVPLLSFTPQVTAAAWAGALLLRGAGPAAAAAVAGTALTAAVGPRAVPCRQPPAAGPVLRVVTANLLAGRAVADAVAELAWRTHADVLFVQELTGDAAARLAQAGLGDLLPYQVTQPVPRGTRGSIYARYPLRGGPPGARPSAARCTARLVLPSGQFVHLACIHAAPPKPWSPGAAARWRSQLSALPAPGEGPHILSPETSTPPSITRSSAGSCGPAMWTRTARPATGCRRPGDHDPAGARPCSPSTTSSPTGAARS